MMFLEMEEEIFEFILRIFPAPPSVGNPWVALSQKA